LLETVEIIGLNRLAPAKRRERERERPTDANLISIMHSAVSEFRGQRTTRSLWRQHSFGLDALWTFVCAMIFSEA
jgi:hypothetical protein